MMALVIIQLQNPVARQKISNLAFDQLQRLHQRDNPDQLPVRVIAIDEKSLEKLGQWPWPRTVMAKLVDQLSAMGAAVVVFDILFSEQDRTSPAWVSSQWPDHPQLSDWLRQLPDHDLVLANSLSQSPTVTGFVINNTPNTRPDPLVKSSFISLGGDIRSFLPTKEAATPNLPIFEQAASGNSVLSLPGDVDGVFRRIPLIFQVKENLYPTLSLEAVRIFLGLPNLMVQTTSSDEPDLSPQIPGLVSIKLGQVQRPVAPNGLILMHYRPEDPDRYISAADLLGGQVETEKISDHVVIIASTAKGLGDRAYSSLGEMMSGVEIHLQLIEQLLLGNYLLQPQWINDAVFILFLGCWIAFQLIFLSRHPIWSTLLTLAITGSIFFLSWTLFTEHSLFFDPIYPAIGCFILFFARVIPKFFQSIRDQRWIYNAFSRYVSPNRVKFLQDNPDHLKLGGEYRQCSFVMTDLAGFTTLMEKNDPALIVSILNQYLDTMIGIAFKHEGTVDRIVGDAVAVLFSTPIVQPDHAARAIACAADMDSFAQQFSQEQTELGIPLGKTRIGVHSGQVLVGNFGGTKMLDYRALGDPINTASRLESVNKHLGTRVCISADTCRQCPDFIGRPIASLVLKGKSEPVEVFEPLSKEAWESPRIKAYLDGFKRLQEESPQALQLFNELAERFPDDPAIRLHRNRLQANERGVLMVMGKK
ncbi:MAG: adenylate/guanylate cyclase domain-containing protein [Magnetococcales bacterium]|nr:adenylate/guanylate cyclase domain-containing protein [Magnetococcales bacterium]